MCYLRWRCPLCPYRFSDRPKRATAHIGHYHREENTYTVSGTQQLVLIQALYDHDMLSSGHQNGEYLTRSSTLIRSHLETPLPNTNIIRYGLLKKVYTGNGVKYMHIDDVRNSKDLRRITVNTYCDMAFHTAVFQQAFTTCVG